MRFEVASNSDVSLSLTALSLTANESITAPSLTFFNGKGEQFTPNPSPGASDSSAIRLDAGVYYLRIDEQFRELSYTISLTAISIPTPVEPEITSIPNSFITGEGDAQIVIDGQRLTPGSRVEVKDAQGNLVSVRSVEWQSNNQLTATLAQPLPFGTYDISVKNQQGTAEIRAVLETAALEPSESAIDSFIKSSLEYGDFDGASLQVLDYYVYHDSLDLSLAAPGSIRPWWTGDVVVSFVNTGYEGYFVNTYKYSYLQGGGPSFALLNRKTESLIAPIISIGITGGLLENPSTGEFTESSIQFLALDNSGDPSLMLAGEGGSRSFRFKLNPGSTGAKLSSNTLEESTIIDWDALKQIYLPKFDGCNCPEIEAEAWDIIFNNFKAAVGTTVATYSSRLSSSAAALGAIGQPIPEIADLLALELQRASNNGEIGRRFRPSPLGLGQSFFWDVSLRLLESGDLQLITQERRTMFTRQSDGTYQPSVDSPFSISRSASGSFLLSSSNGSNLAFDSLGHLTAAMNVNGNSTLLSYGTDGKLSTVTTPTGEVTQYAWNGNLISTISTGTGGATESATFIYDASDRITQTTVSRGGESFSTTTTYFDTGSAKNAVATVTAADGTSETYTYDQQGRISTIRSLDGNGALSGKQNISYNGKGSTVFTDATGHQSTTILNADGLLARSIDASGSVVDYRYDDNRLLQQILVNGIATNTYTYDIAGNLATATDSNGASIRYSSDQDGNLTSIIDANGNRIDFGYNATGLQNRITYADGSHESFAYNSEGTLQSAINRRGQLTSYSFDANDRLSTVVADGLTTTLSYDTSDNLSGISRTRPGGGQDTWRRAFDAAGRLVASTDAEGQTLRITYDSLGRRSSLTYPDGSQLSYLYDDNGRLSGLGKDGGQLLISYSYNELGQLASESKANGTSTQYTYTSTGSMATITHRGAGVADRQFSYSYDSKGLVTSLATPDGKFTYSYDGLGQLTGILTPGGESISYTYDAAGNRLTSSGPKTYTATANNLNQLTSLTTTAGASALTYDGDGNLTSRSIDGVSWNYAYNSANQLISAQASNGDSWSFGYDPFGNRTSFNHNGSNTHLLLDPSNPLVVLAEAKGDTLRRYVNGLGLEAVQDAGSTAFYEFDALGSTTGITGDSGNLLNRYLYLPFGEKLSATEAIANDFEFIGQFGVRSLNSIADTKESPVLVLMGARSYDVDTGRFLQADPIGVTGGINLYAYAINNPTTNIDPSGLSSMSVSILALCSLEGLAAFMEVYDGQLEFQKDLQVTKDILAKAQAQKIMAQPDYPQVPTFFDPKYPPGTIRAPFPQSPSTQDLARSLYPVRGADGQPLGGSNQDFCPLPPPPPPADLPLKLGGKGADITAAVSRDPNDVVGPAGVGSERWMGSNPLLPYQIRFENMAAKDRDDTSFLAVAAQRVTVTTTLDSDLDYSTFELTRVGFGPYSFAVAPGFQSYSAIYSQTEDGQPLTITIDPDGPDGVEAPRAIRVDVALSVDFNPSTGEVTWVLDALDPETGKSFFGSPPEEQSKLTNALIAGILPPNNDAHDGEGFVSYTIRSKDSLITGDAITAKARIVFDSNDFIDTPVWSNSIDLTPPSAQINALPLLTASTEFPVSWSGADAGSGIASYDIYVSKNNGPWEPWLLNTASTSATFTNAEVNSSYRFFARATDFLGLREEAPGQSGSVEAEATTTISVLTVPANDGTGLLSPISGESRVDALLTAGTISADPDGIGSISGFAWYRVFAGNETLINGATSNTYSPVAADLGSAIKVVVSYTDAEGFAESVSAISAIIDQSTGPTEPTVENVVITSATGLQNNTLNAGDTVSSTVRFTTPVIVTGTPLLALSIGGATVHAVYVSGSGTSALVFTTTIEAGQNDTNGINIAANSLSLNGGSISDASNTVAAVLNHSAVGDNPGFLVDTAAPAAGSLSFSGLSDSGSANTPPITSDNSFDLSLSGNENGSTVIYQVSTDAGANWATTTANQSSLADASYLFRALVSDAAGNSSSANAISATVDTSSPAVPGLTLSSDTGISSTDRLTANGNITVTGVDATATWEFSSDAGVTWSAPQSGARTSFTVAAGSYAQGQVQVRQSDADGIITNADASFQAFTVDNTGPNVSTFTLSDFALQSGDTAKISLVFSESVNGFSSNADINASNGVLSAMASADNITWTGIFKPNSDIHDATNFLVLNSSYTDAAGNTGAGATSPNYSIDTTVLAPPTLKLINGIVTASGDWAVFGKPGDTAIVKVEGLDDGSTYTYSVDNGQTWINGEGDSFNIYSLAPSQHWSLIAKKRDHTGNHSPASAVLNFSLAQITAIASSSESFKIKPIAPSAAQEIRKSMAPDAKIQSFTLDYELIAEPDKGQTALIMDKTILPDRIGNAGGYGVGFYGIDPFTSAVSDALTFNASTRGGANAYDLDGDGKLDLVYLRLDDGGIGDWDPTIGAIKGSITSTQQAINPSFSSKGSQYLQVVDPAQPNANVAVNLTATLVGRASTVNEIGFVVVEPGKPITLDLIRRSGNVVFSGLESLGVPDLSSLDFASRFSLRNGQTLRFYETVDTNFADLSRSKSSLSEMGSSFHFLDVSLDPTKGAIRINSPSSVSFELDLSPVLPGMSDLIADRQTEAPVIDCTFSAQADRTLVADWTLLREASYDSTLSFYRILNVEGTVRDPVTGSLVNPGEPGYMKAAYRNRVSEISGLTVGNLQSNGGRVNLKESTLLAPMATVTTAPFENTFFAFAAANTDKLSHFRTLGDNIFGLEDVNGGGDFDFDDLVFSFKPVSLV